jgi:hypothetical protein
MLIDTVPTGASTAVRRAERGTLYLSLSVHKSLWPDAGAGPENAIGRHSGMVYLGRTCQEYDLAAVVTGSRTFCILLVPWLIVEHFRRSRPGKRVRTAQDPIVRCPAPMHT